MLTLITGGAASGKSLYAETLAASSDAERLFYVATMKPEGDGASERIEKHVKRRSDKNFITIECEKDLLRVKTGTPREGSLILLEDLGNLVANEQFDSGGSDEEITARVCGEIEDLTRLAKDIIVVGNDIFSDTADYEKETLRYIRIMARCSRILAGMADSVTNVICGIPVRIK